MTGYEKIQAAFSEEGTPEIPVVICYEDIFIRDHWVQLTSSPWWVCQVPELEPQLEWRQEVMSKIGQDWFCIPLFPSRTDRRHLAVEARAQGVFKVDRRTGQEEQIPEPRIGGWTAHAFSQSIHPDRMMTSKKEIERAIPETAPGKGPLLADGQDDLAKALIRRSGRAYYPLAHIISPLWQCYSLWGFEGFMSLIADQPDLVEYACQRLIRHTMRQIHVLAELGAKALLIEECLTDMISSMAYARLNLPFIQRLTAEIRSSGMKSIYYFCGNPESKWNHLFVTGADALAFEESKKGFSIDIEDVAQRINGRFTLLGNLDSIGILQNGTEQALRDEIRRQIAAGRRNGNRFIMSLGSPVTPETPVERVRLYCDLAREIGANRF